MSDWSVAKMAFKVGDKAKVVDKESLLYNKTVELIDVSNEAYIFYFEPKKLNLMVRKDVIQRTIKWESSPDKAEKNIDKLLGQNGELVEERKKQVLAGALGIIQRYCEETPNKMEAVAQLFGKKLGEEFWIQGFCGVYKVKFTDGGILYLDTDEPNNYRWRLHSIDSLLTGKAEILSDDDWRVRQTLKDLSELQGGDCR